MEKYVIMPNMATRDLLVAFVGLGFILVGRAFKTALNGLKMAANWLRTVHDFGDGETGPIRWTGARYLATCAAVAVAALLMSAA
jgi:hypothetical protein